MEENTNLTTIVLRVLIVEDTPERQEWLKQLYREHAWILVHTAARAITLIQSYQFDLISLDYNLAGPNNGDFVAQTIINSCNQQTPVLIHSMNPKGANELRQLLPHAQALPVGTLFKSNARVKRVREALRSGIPVDWLKLAFDKNNYEGS